MTPLDSIGEIRGSADRGDLANARSACERRLESEHLDFDATLLLALVCHEMHDDRAALDAAERAVYIRDSSAPAHFVCATMLARLGRTAAARRNMTSVLRLLDDGPAAFTGALDITDDHLRAAALSYLASSEPPRARLAGA